MAANILEPVVTAELRADSVIVPMPTGPSGHDGVLAVAELVAERAGMRVISALARDRRRSARRNVAQIRRKIADTEYSLVNGIGDDIQGLPVVLLDDTVTTGSTMTAAARLLRAAGCETLVPGSIDRTISARLAQRLSIDARARCQHRE